MKKYPYKVTTLIGYFCLAASIVYCIIYFAAAFFWMVSPYVNEYREFANIEMTRMILDGKNPYDLSEIPPFFYVYGFVMPFFTACLYSVVDFLHIDLMVFQRLVALAFNVLCGYIAAIEVKRNSHSVIYGFLAFSMVLIAGWSMGLSTALPNTMGVFVMLLTLFRASRIKGVQDVWIVALLTTSTFFIKQYFIIVLVPVFIWLLFRSKKKAFQYILFSFLCFIIEANIVSYFYPAFFSIAIVHHLSVASHSLAHLVRQLAITGLFYFPLLIFFAWIFLKKIKSQKRLQGNIFSVGKPWDSPLVNLHESPNIYGIAVLVNFIVILRLGMHVGAYMTYIYQLLIPVLAVYAMSNIDEIKEGKYRNIFLTAVVVFSLYHIGLFINIPRTIDNNEKVRWESFCKKLDQDRANGLYIYSPLLAKYASDNYIPVWNNGQTEYISTLKNAGITNQLFPDANKIAAKNNERMSIFYQQVSAAQIPVIVTDKLSFIDMPFLKNAGYCVSDSVSLKAGTSASYTVYRWVPCRDHKPN